MNRYIKRENEDSTQYLLRLVEIKLKEKPSDLDWSDIVKLCDMDCHYDSLRKAMQPDGYGAYSIYKYMQDKITSDDITEETILKELTVKKRELEKERIKLQTEKLELREMLRTDARNEMFIEQIINAIDGLKPLTPPELIIVENEKYGIAGYSDSHYGKEIHIRGLNGGNDINIYNPDIYETRMWELLRYYIRTIKREDLSIIHLFSLGDDIDGILRFSQLMSIKYGIVDSTIKFSYFIANWINELSKHLNIKFYMTLGNHDEIRPLGSKSGEFANENMGRVIYEFIKIMLKDNSNIEFMGCSNLLHAKIGNMSILATHGQNERNLEQSIKDYMMIYDIKPNMLLTGHLHNSTTGTVGKNEYGNIDYVRFPSICGVDEFAIKIKKSASAGGKMIIIEGKNRIHYDFVLD